MRPDRVPCIRPTPYLSYLYKVLDKWDRANRVLFLHLSTANLHGKYTLDFPSARGMAAFHILASRSTMPSAYHIPLPIPTNSSDRSCLLLPELLRGFCSSSCRSKESWAQEGCFDRWDRVFTRTFSLSACPMASEVLSAVLCFPKRGKKLAVVQIAYARFSFPPLNESALARKLTSVLFPKPNLDLYRWITCGASTSFPWAFS